jgi:hypothetical protein
VNDASFVSSGHRLECKTIKRVLYLICNWLVSSHVQESNAWLQFWCLLWILDTIDGTATNTRYMYLAWKSKARSHSRNSFNESNSLVESVTFDKSLFMSMLGWAGF